MLAMPAVVLSFRFGRGVDHPMYKNNWYFEKMRRKINKSSPLRPTYYIYTISTFSLPSLISETKERLPLLLSRSIIMIAAKDALLLLQAELTVFLLGGLRRPRTCLLGWTRGGGTLGRDVLHMGNGRRRTGRSARRSRSRSRGFCLCHT